MSGDSERRSAERVVISADNPVHFRTFHQGSEADMLVENLSMGGALLIAPSVCESLQPGQRFAQGVLALSPTNTPEVELIVRWQVWPRVGVQFDGLSSDAADKISQFLLESLRPAVLS